MSAPLEMATGSPRPAIAGYVRRYTGWQEITPAAVRRRETPSADIPLILNLGDPFTLRAADAPGARGDRFGSFVAGIHDRVVETEHPGVSRGVQVDLTPSGARMLFGASMEDLARRTVGLDDLLGPEGPRLVERLTDATGWDRRFAIVDAFIAARLADARRPAGDVEWAWRRLVRTDGRVSVGELVARSAAAAGTWPRAFARRSASAPSCSAGSCDSRRRSRRCAHPRRRSSARSPPAAATTTRPISTGTSAPSPG